MIDTLLYKGLTGIFQKSSIFFAALCPAVRSGSAPRTACQGGAARKTASATFISSNRLPNMGDPLFDGYFIDTQTLGGLVKRHPMYGNQQIKDAIFGVAEAFALALTEPYLTPAIHEVLPRGVAPLAWEIARGCFIQFAVTGAAAAIGAGGVLRARTKENRSQSPRWQGAVGAEPGTR